MAPSHPAAHPRFWTPAPRVVHSTDSRVDALPADSPSGKQCQTVYRLSPWRGVSEVDVIGCGAGSSGWMPGPRALPKDINKARETGRKAVMNYADWRNQPRLRGSEIAASLTPPARLHVGGRQSGGFPENVAAPDALHATQSRLNPNIDQSALRALRSDDFRSHGTKVEHIATTNERNASSPKPPVNKPCGS